MATASVDWTSIIWGDPKVLLSSSNNDIICSIEQVLYCAFHPSQSERHVWVSLRRVSRSPDSEILQRFCIDSLQSHGSLATFHYGLEWSQLWPIGLRRIVGGVVRRRFFVSLKELGLKKDTVALLSWSLRPAADQDREEKKTMPTLRKRPVPEANDSGIRMAYRAMDTTTAATRQGQDKAECGYFCYEDVVCEKCQTDDNEELLLLCDKCDRGFHMYCLSPALISTPHGDWFCPLCIQPAELPVNKEQTMQICYRKRSRPATTPIDTGHYPSTSKYAVVNKDGRMATATDERPSKMRRVNETIRADPTGIARRRDSLRSHSAAVQSSNSGEGDRASESAQGEEGEKKTNILVDKSDRQSINGLDGLDSRQETAKCLAGLLQLNKDLENLDVIVQKCAELRGCAVTFQGGKEIGGDKVIKMSPSPDYEMLDAVIGDAENENENEVRIKMTRGGGFVGIHKFDDSMIDMCPESDDDRREWFNVNCHESSQSLLQYSVLKAKTSGEEESDCLHSHERRGTVMISTDEEDAKTTKDITDLGASQSCSGEESLDCNQRALQKVYSAASSDGEVVSIKPPLITVKALACMRRYGPYSLRIRKDGKRWKRRGVLIFHHIKRKRLAYKRLGDSQFEQDLDSSIVQSLLMKGKQNEETAMPDDTPDDDEDLPYEAYSRSSNMAREAREPDPDDEELEDFFKDLALATDKGWERKEATENQIAVSKNGGCSHKFYLDDDQGFVCEMCGLVGQDIQSIFLQDRSRPKKKAAIVPVHEELDPESTYNQGLSIPQEALQRQSLALHPFYEEKLHPHQKEGILFLTKNLLGDAQSGLPEGGCILAHAPGTGKSCLTVSFVQSFLTACPTRRALIVAPKIMLRPWQNEFAQWSVNKISVYNLNETFSKESKRKSTRKERDHDLSNLVTATPHYQEKLGGRRLRTIRNWLETRSVLLVSYNLFAGLVLAGLEDENTNSVKQIICQALLDGPKLLILDEGHFPRTKRTKISQALMRVKTHRKILLSGTLFQNNFREVFNLMKLARHNFMTLSPEFAKRLKSINPKQQPSNHEDNHFCGRTYEQLNLEGREVEEQMFMDEIGYKLEEFVEGAENFQEINSVLRKLRALTAPTVHWYTGQILESLPGLSEFVVYLNLTDLQQKLLSRLKCKSSFEEKTRIAEVCIHPELLKYEENLQRAVTAGCADDYDSRQKPSYGVKTAFLVNLVRLCHLSGERLLIFCQTLSPLAFIESMLTKIFGWSRGKEILHLDGSMQTDERQSMIAQFNDGSSKACVMLASITACKEGISLVGASRVVILDVLYNPAVVRQAVSRAFRIGQKKKVYVYRLVAADTKEEKIFQAAVQKDWLSRVLMDQSFRMSGNRFHAEKILRVDEAPEDRILKKLLQTDTDKNIDRVCRYHSDLSK